MTQPMSIYIPHVFTNITKEFIMKTFENWQIGKVHHVDFTDKIDKKGKMYYSAYVHFDSWFDNVVSQNFQDRVKNPEKEAKLVYSDPWFWVCLENTSSHIVKKVNGSGGERKIKINLDDLFASAIASNNVKKNNIENDEKINDENNNEIVIYNEPNNKVDMNYVRHLEIMNYKLMYDLRNIQGDFIMV